MTNNTDMVNVFCSHFISGLCEEGQLDHTQDVFFSHEETAKEETFSYIEGKAQGLCPPESYKDLELDYTQQYSTESHENQVISGMNINNIENIEVLDKQTIGQRISVEKRDCSVISSLKNKPKLIDSPFFIPGSEVPLSKPILIGNWKMNGTKEEVEKFLRDFLDLYEEKKYYVTTLFAFPTVFLLLAHDILKKWKDENRSRQNLPIFLISQDCSCHKNGSYTGQISASMLRNVGCQFTLVGHPECPWEDKSYIYEVSKRSLRENIIPVICLRNIHEDICRIPFTQSPHEPISLYQNHKKSLEIKHKQANKNISKEKKGFFVSTDGFFCFLAYEPCVGANEPAQNLEQDSGFLRHVFPRYPLLYGGGINNQNLEPLCALFDGFLVGRASLTLESFFPLLEILWKGHAS